MNVQNKLTLLAASLVVSAPALALQPLVTDDTGTQGMGGNQLEFAWGHDSDKATGGGTTRTDSFPVVYTRGLTDTVDVSVGLPWVRSNASGANKAGTGNASLGFKWRFFEQEGGWSMALKPEVGFPVSSGKETNGVGDHATTYDLSLLLQHETAFGDVLINAGYGYFNDKNAPGTDADTLHFSVAPVWKLTEQTLLALDVGVDHENPKAGASDTSHYVLVGLMHSPNDDLDLAVGLQKTFSVAGSDNVWMGTVGLTWRFK